MKQRGDVWNNHQLPNALANEASFLKQVILDDCGHFVPEEHPDVFNKIVREFIE